MTPIATPPQPRTRALTSSPTFLQGVFGFTGQGLDDPFLLDPVLTYTVPRDHEAQLVYFRGGNGSDAMAYVVVMRDGAPMRWFPIGAQSGTHVPLRVVEDLLAGTTLELFVGAPVGVGGELVIDLGLVEV